MACKQAHMISRFISLIKRNLIIHNPVQSSFCRINSRQYCDQLHCESPYIVSCSKLNMSTASPVVNGCGISSKINGKLTDEELFGNLFPQLVQDIISVGQSDSQIKDACDWYRKVNDYNVPHGKRNRGLTVLHSYRYLMGERVTDEGVLQACVIGWCIEWLQAYFLVSDDIMDSSITRRGQPCWYKQPGVGLIAINDAFHLECAIYVLLRKYIKGQPYYTDILDLFHETTHQTVIGQSLDMLTAPTDRVDFSNYTQERYESIVKYKTAFYSFYLPVAAAMYMSGITDETSHESAKEILLKMGEYFQIQDDYLDCYGDPSVTGKIGTDIEDNKCGWFIVQALKKATPEQRSVLEENYARKDSVCVARVRQVYDELKLELLYHEYEQQSYHALLNLIDQLCSPTEQKTSPVLPRQMFIDYARKIYKRQK